MNKNYHKNMNSEKKKQNRNLGIEILRMILCFWVLSFHCLNKSKIGNLLNYITKKKFYHVPCFSFISFYFSYNIFSSRNIKMAQRRFERLLIPYIIWPSFIFINNNVLHFFFKDGKRPLSFNDLKIQIISGRQFIIPLWFLFSMIFLTLLFLILSFTFKKYFLFITQLLAIISYIMQYSEIYSSLNNYKNNVRLPIFDTLSMLPLSAIGLIFSSFNKINILKENLFKTLFFSYLFLFLLFKYEFFITMNGYRGIEYIFSSLLLFIGFYLLPFEYTYSWIQLLIKQITSYTNGIYCLQGKIISFVRFRIDKSGTFKTSVISYILLYAICFFGANLFKKCKLKYLFI